MVYGVVAWQEGYGIIMDDIQRIGWWEVSMWFHRHYLLIYCLCGTVGPWVKVPKALEEDTLMLVYGVGPAPWVLVPKDTGLVLPLGRSPKRHGVGPTLRYESQKTRGMTCPWVMSQNSHYYIDRVSCGAWIFDV